MLRLQMDECSVYFGALERCIACVCRYTVRDIWKHEELDGMITAAGAPGTIKLRVGGLDSAFLRLTPTKPKAPQGAKTSAPGQQDTYR